MVKSDMNSKNFFDILKAQAGYKKLVDSVLAGKSCSVFGVQNSMRPALSLMFGKKILYLVSDSQILNLTAEAFEMLGYKTLTFKAVQDSFIYKKSQSNELYLARTKLLFDILGGDFDVVVCEVSALTQFLPSVSDFCKHILSIKVGQNFEHDELENLLIEAGYKREEMLYEKGQFSRRGEVLDIFPVSEDVPYRIDFFDTEIESIKVFDMQTQKGTKEVKKLKICPYTDLFLTKDEVEHLTVQVEKLKKNENSEVATLLNAQIDEIVSRLEMNDTSYCLDLLASYLDDFRANIFDYFKATGQEFVTIVDEAKQTYDALTGTARDVQERIRELKNAGTLISGNKPCIFSIQEILENFKDNVCVAFLKITNNNRFFNSSEVYNFKTQPFGKFMHNLKEFSKEIVSFNAGKYKTYILAGNKEQAGSIKSILSSYELDLEIKAKPEGEGSAIFLFGYPSGFVLPDEKIVVVGTYDIFPKRQVSKKLKLGSNNTFSIPKIGDYVVHHYHGIGVCEGVTKLTGTLGTQDYLVIRYRDGDKLYVPTSHMDMLERFSGAEEPKRLSKIGGQDFSLVKDKVKESLRKMAFNLLELYAKRESIQGFAFSEDNDLQLEFENSFPYTETEDQLATTEEIKQDMQKNKVMDRLLCGDVGFGKTEVAMRAMFKAIMDGKQVAFIAPTTILSEQHYNTARARMNNFGISIEVLNRFKTKAETEKILKAIKQGKVDLVCGTHRVLSKDVEFKNLGLIVMDEEQKFGVEDKEKLKNKYPSVDVLTLSATPIPRTLSMSLSGIRDISIISTPPSERLPIQTYAVEYSESLVKDAVEREISRGGQVFILYNSVEKIYTYAERIKRLLPDLTVAVAHGQMGSKALEKVIYDFYHKMADVLICTTIIENGIDLENVNTLIVCDSDKLGLSQLYQIRGRVGRSSRLAYAYFTYEYNKVLSVEAYKRLDALSEFCEFGSGFKLAMRDLEIRGGGNVLGAEQSGHMQKIGYDMYSKLLQEVVSELKGEKVKNQSDVLVKVHLDAFIPEEYISTSEDRMLAYKRISEVDSVENVQKLVAEISGIYGKIPTVVENLISISLVRKLAQKIAAVEVSASGKNIQIVFNRKEDITENQDIIDVVYKNRMNCTLELGQKPCIVFKSGENESENFELAKKFLLNFANL